MVTNSKVGQLRQQENYCSKKCYDWDYKEDLVEGLTF